MNGNESNENGKSIDIYVYNIMHATYIDGSSRSATLKCDTNQID